MSAAVNEHTLAEQLCGELLIIPELRQLCQTRGFPLVGSGKEEQARSAAARLLDARGVGEVMAKLGPVWLKLLHLAKARRAPVAMDAIIQIVDRDPGAVWRYDYRAFFRLLVTNLLVKGVALVNEGPAPCRSNSRYARFQLVLPEPFQSELPFYPIAAEPLGSGGTPSTGDLDELLEGSLRVFTEKRSLSCQSKPSALAEMLAAEFKLDGGLLTLCSSSRPTPEGIVKTVIGIWQKSLPSRSTDDASDAGSVAGYILRSLPNEMGCTAAQLAAELKRLGFSCKSEAVAAFCDQGTAAGLLLRKDRDRADPLYRAVSQQLVPSRTKLKLVQRNGQCTLAPPVALLPCCRSRQLLVQKSSKAYCVSSQIRSGWGASGMRCHKTSPRNCAQRRPRSSRQQSTSKNGRVRSRFTAVLACFGLRTQGCAPRCASALPTRCASWSGNTSHASSRPCRHWSPMPRKMDSWPGGSGDESVRVHARTRQSDREADALLSPVGQSAARPLPLRRLRA